MRKVIILIIVIIGVQVYSQEGIQIGKIDHILAKGHSFFKEKEAKIRIKGVKIGAKIMVGATLYVRIEGKIIKMRAKSPTLTKVFCILFKEHQEYFNKIRKDMPVYLFHEGLDSEEDVGINKDSIKGKTKIIGGIEFVYINGGEFKMGYNSTYSYDETPIHRVEVSSFWIGKYEVTQKQYKEVMGKNPSRFGNNFNNPVDQVSWYDAIEFCNRLSIKTGRKPYYEIDKRSKDPNNKSKFEIKKWKVMINKGSNGFRLPYESEWEYAARAGTETKFYWGNSFEYKIINEYAIYCRNSHNGWAGSHLRTYKVGTKRPNQWGLYDMSGNVWEWCFDWYDNRYYSNSVPQNLTGSVDGAFRIYRGGSGYTEFFHLRSANRCGNYPDFKSYNIGFRIVVGD